jgi:hypothetical protein
VGRRQNRVLRRRGKFYEHNQTLGDRQNRICAVQCVFRSADRVRQPRGVASCERVCATPASLCRERTRGAGQLCVLPWLRGLLQWPTAPIRISRGPFMGIAICATARFRCRARCLAVGEARFPRFSRDSSRGDCPAISQTLGATSRQPGPTRPWQCASAPIGNLPWNPW